MVRFHLTRLEPVFEFYAGPINFTPETRSALSELKQAGETFARMIEVSNRLTEAGLSAGAVLNLKPWEMPTVGTITEEHFAKLEAAIAAAKK